MPQSLADRCTCLERSLSPLISCCTRWPRSVSATHPPAVQPRSPRDKFGWDVEKTSELLDPVLKAFDERLAQRRIDEYLSLSQRFAKFRSKRLQLAVERITGNAIPDLVLGGGMDGSSQGADAEREGSAGGVGEVREAPKKAAGKKRGRPALDGVQGGDGTSDAAGAGAGVKGKRAGKGKKKAAGGEGEAGDRQAGGVGSSQEAAPVDGACATGPLSVLESGVVADAAADVASEKLADVVVPKPKTVRKPRGKAAAALAKVEVALPPADSGGMGGG